MLPAPTECLPKDRSRYSLEGILGENAKIRMSLASNKNGQSLSMGIFRKSRILFLMIVLT